MPEFTATFDVDRIDADLMNRKILEYTEPGLGVEYTGDTLTVTFQAGDQAEADAKIARLGRVLKRAT